MIFKIISVLPHWLVYFIADVLGFFFFRVNGYRKEVIRNNIKSCFPEFSEDELKQTERDFKRQFLHVLGEAILAYRFKPSDWKDHIVIEQAKKVKEYIRNNKTALVAYGHMANWEWPFLSLKSILNVPVEFLYRPMEKNSVDATLLKFRQKHGAKGLPKDSAIRHILRNKDKPKVIGMIADQIPSIGTEKQWHNFLGRETAFYQGLEKIAIATQSPVFFLEVIRTDRGQYQCTFHEIAKPPYSKDTTGIIKAYTEKLEENIRKMPYGYLWSHRRWKYTKEEDITIQAS